LDDGDLGAFERRSAKLAGNLKCEWRLNVIDGAKLAAKFVRKNAEKMIRRSFLTKICDGQLYSRK
jgi:hypothetical protein